MKPAQILPSFLTRFILTLNFSLLVPLFYNSGQRQVIYAWNLNSSLRKKRFNRNFL